MEISNYTIIISSAVVMTGWIVNNILSRRHEIAKKRLEYRLETLHSFIPVYLSLSKSTAPFIDDKKLHEKINTASINFQLYGFQDEIDILNTCLTSIEKNDGTNATIALNQLIELIKSRLRNELKLPKIK